MTTRPNHASKSTAETANASSGLCLMQLHGLHRALAAAEADIIARKGANWQATSALTEMYMIEKQKKEIA